MRKKRIRWNIEKVKQYFEDHDCELFETEYINNKTPMKYKCTCGNDECKISFSNFRKGKKCMECSGSKKYTFEEVKKYFKDHNCGLLETEYINNSTLMKYRCSCRNSKCKISFASFKKGTRCNNCGTKRTAIKLHLSFSYVYNYFKDRDCKLLETEYINNYTLMKYECSSEHYDCKISFASFKKGQRCKKCSDDNQRMSYEFVYNYFKKCNCELLEKIYINNYTPMKYRCECGNKDCKISFSGLKNGHRCME